MRVRIAAAALAAAAWLVIGVGTSGCGTGLGRQYEYEEQLYLSVDGSATVVVDASFPAFVALRGLPLDPAPHARTDRDEVRRVFETGGCHVLSVGQAWRRDGRRFIQIRISTEDVRTLGKCGPLGWSAYSFEPLEGGLHYRQLIGAAAAANPGETNWNGSEVVGFKLHLPSRVIKHNVRLLSNGEPGDLERGNILTWEQTLADRRAGKPIDLDVQIDAESILYRTLWLFAGAFVAAVLVIAAIVWWIVRRGRAAATSRRPPA